MNPSVYFMRPIGLDGPVKIGCSVRPHDRLTTYAAWSPMRLEIAVTTPGYVHLERRFHAAFAAHRSHHEWFNAAPEITATIEALREGRFDFSTLPAPRCLTGKKSASIESIEAGIVTRRLDALRRAGTPIPADVAASKSLYRNTPAEVMAWRAATRAFVLQHDPRPLRRAA